MPPIHTNKYHLLWLCICIVLYPAMGLLTAHLPNPMVPGAYLGLNMIVPVLAGYFLGPVPGGVAGGAGTALAALIWESPFSCAAIIPHIIMGWTAGRLGSSGSPRLASLSIIVGHLLNILMFICLDLLPTALLKLGSFWLGLATEISIDIVAIILLGTMLPSRLYRQR